MRGAEGRLFRTVSELFMLLVLLTAGCRSAFGPLSPYPSRNNPMVTQEDMRLHVIQVDRDGDFYENGVSS